MSLLSPVWHSTCISILPPKTQALARTCLLGTGEGASGSPEASFFLGFPIFQLICISPRRIIPMAATSACISLLSKFEPSFSNVGVSACSLNHHVLQRSTLWRRKYRPSHVEDVRCKADDCSKESDTPLQNCRNIHPQEKRSATSLESRVELASLGQFCALPPMIGVRALPRPLCRPLDLWTQEARPPCRAVTT